MMRTDLIAFAEERIAQLPLEALKHAGIQLDRVEDNPEAARYFLAYGDWGKVSSSDIFEHMDPGTGQSTQIYMDFPYCPKVCNFCAFYGTLAKSASDQDRYIQNMKREIDLMSETYFARNPDFRAETVELGGGTPTFFTLEQLQDVLGHLFKRFPFGAPKQHSFEATPDTIVGDMGYRKLELLKSLGFVRMSIGAQSFDEHVLKHGNRPHEAHQIEEGLKNVRALGFERINFDLMLGLADQTVESFLDSVQRSMELGIEIIEIYTMRFFDTKKHVGVAPLVGWQSRFMTEHEILVGRLSADQMLREAGYRSSNGRTYHNDSNEFYADYYAENFKGSNVLGLGRKSHSNVYPWQYANYRNVEKYNTHLEAGRLPIAAGCHFEPQARVAKLLTGALQLPQPLDFQEITNHISREAAVPFVQVLSLLVEQGLLERNGQQYTKTFLGFIFIEEMLKLVFDASVKPFNSQVPFLGKDQKPLKLLALRKKATIDA
jgi:oxygen-independent coproporphyrinogen-3 oxidase